MLHALDLEQGLAQFVGTEQWHRVYPDILLTDGVKWLCDHAECYWLVDIIRSCQMLSEVSKEPFQAYTLTVNPDISQGTVTCTDGNDTVLYTQDLMFTDFPLKEINLWYSQEEGIVLLPSEY